MSLYVVWFLAWTASVCWTALFLRRRGLILVLAAAALPAVGIGSLWLASLQARVLISDWPLFLLSWLIAYVLAAIYLGALGLRTRRDDGRRAASWPRAPFLALLGLCLAGGSFALWWHDRETLTTLRQLLQTGRAALDDLRPPTPATATPPGEAPPANAAVLYEQAWQQLGDPDRWSTADGALAAKAQAVTAHAASFDLIRRAAATQACAFDEDLSAAGMLRDPVHLRRLAMSQTLLGASAQTAALLGNDEDAIRDLRAVQGIGRHIATLCEPAAPRFASLRALVIESDVLETLFAQRDPAAPFPPDWITPTRPDHAALARRAVVLNCETAQVLVSAIALGAERSETAHDEFAAAVGPFSGTTAINTRLLGITAEIAALRRLTDEFLGVLDSPPLVVNAEVSRRFNALRQPRSGLLNNLFFPGQPARTVCDGYAWQRLVDTATAIAHYRARRGKYPKQLSALVPTFLPEIPVSPFDGKPLMLTPYKNGLAVYWAKHPRTGRPIDVPSLLDPGTTKQPAFLFGEAYTERYQDRDANARDALDSAGAPPDPSG